MTSIPSPGTAGEPLEARSGLAPFQTAELPPAPAPRGLRQWLSAIGPGIIVLGASLGSGEFLLGPAVVVKHGFTLLWIAGVAIVLQTVFNTELMRYTLATGEPVLTGFMRTRPRSSLWAGLYVLLGFLQHGWPAWAATAAGALFFTGARRLPGDGDTDAVFLCAVLIYLVCVAVLLVGRRVERTLEVLNWVLVTVIMAGLLALTLAFAGADTLGAALAGYVGYDPGAGRFLLIPDGADWFLLGAFAAFSGAGGMGNIALSNWARDKGYGMSQHAGYIPAAMGEKVDLAHTGFGFTPTPEALARWRGWWRLVQVDQYLVFFLGAVLGMMLPALLYVTFVPAGTDIRGLGVAAELAFAMAKVKGPIFGGIIAIMAVWVLFKTQLDLLEAGVRTFTDVLWTGSRRIREWRGGDVRRVYYAVLGFSVMWGLVALRLGEPVWLLQVAANVGGLILAVAALHLLYVNCTLLPKEVRPAPWRRVALVLMAAFYGMFFVMWAWKS
jgi:hypothetical protein